MEARICESCGMPMETPDQFGGGDTTNHYCVFCTDEQGNLKTWEQKVEDMTGFIMTRMNIEEAKAKQMAKENLVKQPAWAEYKDRI